MQLQHEFTLPIPPETAWETLLDVERVAPCMPGAMLDRVDGDDISGRVTLKLGPLRLSYHGDARIAEKDAAQHRLVIAAEGREARGSGTAAATVAAALNPAPEGTLVALQTDLTLTGRPAQFGRGLVNDVAGTIIGQFADRLSHEMTNGSTPRPSLPPLDEGAESLPAAGTAASGSASGAGAWSGPSSRADNQAGDNALDALSVLRPALGTRGLVALGSAAAVVVAFLLRRRRRRSAAVVDAHRAWPAVFVIDAGEK